MSFKPEVTTGSDPKFYDNALAFATREEAEANAKDLFGRWTLCTGWRAVESTDPVTHSYMGGVLRDPIVTPPCKGLNCGVTDGVSHSPECRAEHDACCDGVAAKRVFKLTGGIAALVRVCEDDKPERSAIWLGPERGAVVDVREHTMAQAGWPQAVQDSINAHFKIVFDLEHEGRADLSTPSPRAVYVDALQPWTVEVAA
jgi:hypothetical protein